MEFKDYYKILQLKSDASQDDIRQAYRRLVQKFHPDINPADNAEERFKEIQEAYDILKDPQKRTLYHYSYKTIKPYTYDWLSAKIQGWWYVYAQLRARKQAEARVYAQRDNRSSLPLFLLGSGILLLLITLVSGIFIYQRPDDIQDEPQFEMSTVLERQIVTAILQGKPEGIEQLQNLSLYMQTLLLQQTGVKHAVTNYFINHYENDVITALKNFDASLQEEVFKRDETIKRLLMAHYYRLADEQVSAENFTQAIQCLDSLNAYIADLPGFAEKYNTIQMLKNERLAELVAQYQQCLSQSEHALLEKTPCFAHTRHSIARIDSAHPILVTPDLSVSYATAIEQALTGKALEQAEQLMTAWQTVFPQQQEQQRIFQQKLTAQHQINKVITVLINGDDGEIAQSLGYLRNIESPLREEILDKPKVRENLLNFYMKELLTLMQLADKPVQPYLQLIEQFDSKTLAVETPVVKSKTADLLKQCEKYYRTKRLTKGKRTALSCYKEVLARDPKNAIALLGLEKIEHLFQVWAENALRKSELDKMTYYLLGLEKVNPQSTALTDLKKRLRWKKSQQIQPQNPLNSQQSVQAVPAVKQKQPVKTQVKTVEVQPTQQRQMAPPPKKIAVGIAEEQNVTPPCVGCSCADLLRQLSIGVKPLTVSQQAFLKQCY